MARIIATYEKSGYPAVRIRPAASGTPSTRNLAVNAPLGLRCNTPTSSE